MSKFLDYTGLQHFWDNLKSYFVKGKSSGTTENHVVTWGENGYIVKDSGFTIGKSVPSDAKFTDTTYSNATTTSAGLMSPEDKTNLDNLVGNTIPDATTTTKGVVKIGTNVSVSNGTISVADATTSKKGVAQLSDSISSSSSDTAATSKAVKSAYDLANSAIKSSQKGIANGVAELDANGKVPSSQLPSFVDDVIEGYYYNSKFYKEESHTTIINGETGKIYVDLVDNKTYRWGGTSFVVISDSLALGETISTAYRGDRGKTAYDHSQVVSGNPHNVTKSDVGLGNVENKSSATIRGEITSSNVTTALGFTPLKSTDNVSSATKLQTSRTIDGVNFDGSNNIVHFGTCSTAASTVAKVVACSSYILGTGAVIRVKFSVTNTASSPTLNVNSTGAKAIKYRGSDITASMLASGRIYEFVYDGTNYELVGDLNLDTKNTAGSTNSTSKLFIIGATSQGENPQTYSNVNCYIGTDNYLYSNGKKCMINGDVESITVDEIDIMCAE